MSWQEPYTEWADGNRFTYEDMNRIAGNINYLYPDADLKDDYTNNDFLSVQEWGALMTALNTLVALIGLDETTAGWAGTAETINEVEDLTKKAYDRIGLIAAQAPATIYSGDDLYTAEPVENYVRGV